MFVLPIELTDEGAKIAKIGIKTHENKIKWWDRTIKIKDVIAIIVGLITIIAFFMKIFGFIV